MGADRPAAGSPCRTEVWFTAMWTSPVRHASERDAVREGFSARREPGESVSACAYRVAPLEIRCYERRWLGNGAFDERLLTRYDVSAEQIITKEQL